MSVPREHFNIYIRIKNLHNYLPIESTCTFCFVQMGQKIIILMNDIRLFPVLDEGFPFI